MEPLDVEVVDAVMVDEQERLMPDSRHSFVEKLLSPESLQWMMLAGGGLLLGGFILWLWSIGVFNNPIVAAISIGAANLGILLTGVALVKYSRHELAGQGLALLGSLALPLNLWFYDAQGLITIANGGHLWIPAAIICCVYALVARVLRDARFVYALVGGIVMTGMLFLADANIGRFWMLLPQVTFLASTGWLSILAARQFPTDDGEFSRGNFGKAFHRAGTLVLFGGLTLLLGGQAVAFFETAFGNWLIPQLATDPAQKLWAVGILGCCTLGFILEYLFPDESNEKATRHYAANIVVISIWWAVSLLDFLAFQLTVSQMCIAIAALVAAANCWIIVNRRFGKSDPTGKSTAVGFIADGSVAVAAALFMVAVPQFVAQHIFPAHGIIFTALGWTAILHLATTAIAIGIVAVRTCLQRSEPGSSNHGSAFDSSAMLAAAAGIVATLTVWSVPELLGTELVSDYVIGGLVLPMLLATTSALTANLRLKRIAQIAGSFATTLLILLVALYSVAGLLAATGVALVWSALFAGSSVVYFVAAIGRGNTVDRVLGFVTAALAASQLAVAAGLSFDYSLVLGPSVAGAILVLVNVFRKPAGQVSVTETFSLATIGTNLVLIGNVCGVLLSLSHVIDNASTLSTLAMLAGQLACLTIAGLGTESKSLKRACRVSAGGNVLAMIAVVNSIMLTHWAQRVEIGMLLAGTALLIIGYLAWSKEDDDRDPIATTGLTLGSLLVAIPLSIGLVYYRFADAGLCFNWQMFHEATAILFGLLLLGTGLLGKIRATTIAGAAILAVHVASLVLLVELPEQLQSVSVMMMIGGGVFFATAVLLSLYRDRILDLPKKVRDWEGVFQVLTWR